MNYSRRNGLSTEDEWLFVGDISEEEIKHGMSFLREIVPVGEGRGAVLSFVGTSEIGTLIE